MTDQANIEDLDLIEKLAAIEHERWADWQRWLHSKLQPIRGSGGDGLLMLPEDYQHWEEQIAADYSELSEKEKQSDRDQVMRYWPLLQAHIERKQAEARIDERSFNITLHIPDSASKEYSQGFHDAVDQVVKCDEARIKVLKPTNPTKHTDPPGRP